MSLYKKPHTIRLRPADGILITILLSLSLTGFILQKSKTDEARFFIIEMDGKILYRFPTHRDTTITLSGKTGIVAVKVMDGKVCIAESSCPLKICIKTGWITSPGQAIICIPNKLIVSIEGKKQRTVDAITQ